MMILVVVVQLHIIELEDIRQSNCIFITTVRMSWRIGSVRACYIYIYIDKLMRHGDDEDDWR